MSDRIWVGSRKGLFELRRGKIAQLHFAGQPVSAILETPRYVLCALNLGHFGAKLWRSGDGGKSWQEVACPAYPQEEGGASLNQIWVMEADADNVWAGTIPGGLFRSRDRGDSWALVDSLWNRDERKAWFGGGADAPGIHSILLDGRNVTVAISCGGVWKSADQGASWQLAGAGMRAAYMPPGQQEDPNTQDPHRVVQCRAAPKSMWAQHHNGIYRSGDAGRSWEEVTNVKPSSFGFAVAVHPHKPEVAWFVPAIKDELRYPVDGKLVVTRTRDGGRSFERLSEGLPQEHAYDLVYRHALDIDESGARLAMGSTTGGLWTSANAGDAWQCVGAHLPPIYCVRFGSPA
jgi:photosystem II stability/assembly factor-like uncharacterized protein